MIASGEKKEEYREIKPYYLKRLFEEIRSEYECSFHDACEILRVEYPPCPKALSYDLVNYDVVKFRNGYSKEAPTIILEFKGIDVREGKEDWGAVKGEKYFVIKLGEVVK